MSKKYILVVSDLVRFKVEGVTKDGDGKEIPFKFSLVADRMSTDELAETMASESKIADTLARIVKGWSDQRLVLEEDRTPAEFTPEAFAALMTIPHMGLMCFNAYHRATGAAVKN